MGSDIKVYKVIRQPHNVIFFVLAEMWIFFSEMDSEKCQGIQAGLCDSA